MTVSRRSLLKLLSLAPALGIGGATLERLFDAAANAPDLPDPEGPLPPEERALGVLIDGSAPIPLQSLQSLRPDAIEVTLSDSTERQYVGQVGPRRVRLVLGHEGPFPWEGTHDFEIRLAAATLTFRAAVEAVTLEPRAAPLGTWEVWLDLSLEDGAPLGIEVLS